MPNSNIILISGVRLPRYKPPDLRCPYRFESSVSVDKSWAHPSVTCVLLLSCGSTFGLFDPR